MFRFRTSVAVAACLTIPAFAQTPARVDFARDIQPVLRQNCVGCHGPSQQMAGMRLDRKSSALKAGMRRIVPGSLENSFLFHRIVDSEFGTQMPPTGPLKPEQVKLIQAWIEQGAEWPDSLSNETSITPVNPKAVAMVEALRIGDRPQFLKSVDESPGLLNARGPDGSTPFLYATIYGDVALMEQLLKKGADPNLRNDAKATALLWAATNLEKTRLLVAHGADVNVRSDDGRTPLMIASGRPGGSPLVKLLLEHGANPNPTKNPDSESSPLIQAALAGDAESIRLLIAHGADLKASRLSALGNAWSVECNTCVDLLLKGDLDKMTASILLSQMANIADAKTVRYLLDKGADPNMVDPFGHTAIMYAVVSDLIPVDVVKLLIDHGANVNAKSAHSKSRDTGMSVLDIARMQGETPVVELLRQAGATSALPPVVHPSPKPAATISAAIARSLPMLQKVDASFSAKSGCISCHSNSLEGMAVGLAQRRGLAVNQAMVGPQVKTNADYLVHLREPFHQGFFLAQAGAETGADIFGPQVISYILVGLDAQQYKPDLNTDAAAMYLKSRQMPDGRWAYTVADTRQPLGSLYFGQSVLSMRALQLYAPNVDKSEYESSIRLAAQWIARTEAKGNADRYWKLMGLGWYGKDKEATQKALRDVRSLQHPDGGWSDLPTTESAAFATGLALVAMSTAGVPAQDAAFQRGVQFLMKTQLEDGTWFVATRSLGFQPYFETGFPHGLDQSISAAGTSWATLALTLASSQPAGDSR